MNEQVKCISLLNMFGTFYITLTLDRVYEVERKYLKEYKIRNDRGELYWYPVQCFCEPILNT